VPPKQLKCWYINLEDGREEIERRIAAICLRYGVKPEELGDRLFFDGAETELVLASQTRTGTIIAEPVFDALKKALIDGKFDVLILDPFVSTHRVSENDNMAIDAVVKGLGKVGKAAHCSVELVHHVRKTGGAEITAEDARGARASRSRPCRPRASSGFRGI
jgi:RecA-family ATPase